MKKNTRIILLTAVLMAVCGLGYLRYRAARPYTPSPELAEAYGSLSQAEADRPDSTLRTGANCYDIEKTVRIMNSLEVAQARSGSFDELLLYMARQDYGGVAKEVLAAKKRMFPILEEMNALRKQYDDASSVMGYLRCVSRQAEEGDLRRGGLGATMLAMSLTQGRAALETAFDAYREQQHLKKELAAKLAKINREYIRYVEEYAPVYHKYMREWDALCLLKDRAYIDLYSGRYADALNNAEKVLALSPENEEGLLLKACALIESGPAAGRTPQLPAVTEGPRPLPLADPEAEAAAALADPRYYTAERILDEYLRRYPDKAAPALVLQGLLYRRTGRPDKAMASFEQAAVEYPRQAEALTDILNAYNNRAYLDKSAEGLYLLNYYRSTMEGFGMFSPNFQKAALLLAENRIEESRQEIYRHFFRRSRQAAYHCLLSDMQYCETHLPAGFRSLFLEAGHIDLEYEPSAAFLGMGRKSDRLDVALVNRSDLRLENVRLFLCIHYTGMYTDDYEVVKVPLEKNLVQPFERVGFDAVELAPHTVDAITRIRAIVVADDRIGWIDTPEIRRSRATAAVLRPAERAEAAEAARRGNAADDFVPDAPEIKRLIAERMRVNDRPLRTTDRAPLRTARRPDAQASLPRRAMQAVGELFGDKQADKLRIDLPRILALFDPVFTIHAAGETDKTRYPERNTLSGEYIRLVFDLRPGKGETVPLYLYGNALRLRIEIAEADGSFELIAIEEV